MFRLFSLATFVLIFVRAVSAGPGHEKVEMPKEFDTLKALLGTWEGTSAMEGKPGQNVMVTYELTSAGTAIVEKLMAGTPDEMVTIYHKEGKGLALTHYCALGNQPHMPLKKADGQSLVFEMTKPVGVSSMKESHMHAVTLTMSDPNSLKQEWTHFSDGKKKGTAIFTLTRKKA